VTGLQSLSKQPLDNSPRLLAIQGGSPDTIEAIDPATWGTQTLESLSGSDNTRRLKTATVSRDTAVAITSGTGIGTPETLKIIRGDTVTNLPWPAPPQFSVTWSKREEGGAPAGTYVIRLAWRMEDGTVGPASGPLLTTTPEVDTDATYGATISVDGYPGGKPSGGWPDRIEGLAIIVHPEAASSSATDVSAPDVPGYRVSSFDGLPDVGTTTTWKDSLESIIAAQSHDTRTLVHHGISAGALYSFNGRLILGDVAYDYERPQLAHMVSGADGGTDYHLTMRVDIETSQGTITRYAEPLGFSTSAADNVQMRQGTIFYRDRRARSWAWLVSQDYTGDIDAATWKTVQVQGTEAELKEAGNANFSYVEPGRDTISITTFGVTSKNVTDNSNWTGNFSSSSTEIDSQDADSPGTEETNTTDLDVETNILGTDEDLSAVRVDLRCYVDVSASGGGYGSGDATISIGVLDGTGDSANVLDSRTFSADKDTSVTGVKELSDFAAADAVAVRIETSADADATANGGSCTTTAGAEALDVDLDIVQRSGGTTEATDQAADSAERDRDATRLVWSEVNRPLDLPIENVAYVAEDADDPILAITSNAAPVSEGQYGDYPLLVLGRQSIWSLQTGSDPFVQGVSPIAPDMGVVSRTGFTNANGPVYVATDRGIARLTPTVDGVVSTQLHDGNFLDGLGPDTSLGYFTSEQGRREVWVATGGSVYVFSQGAQAWSTLPASRGRWARLEEELYGLDGGEAVLEGGGGSTYSTVIETAPCFLGAPSSAKRLRDVWLIQGARPTSSTQLLHVRGVGDGAYGLDYATDLSVTMRLSRGLVQAASFWLKSNAGEAATFSGVGVRYEYRDRRRPNAPVTDDGQLLGASATQSDLDTDLNW
jgi:hypothetical protein